MSLSVVKSGCLQKIRGCGLLNPDISSTLPTVLLTESGFRWFGGWLWETVAMLFLLIAVPVGEIRNEEEVRMLTGALVAVVSGMIGMMWLLVKTLAHSKDAAQEARQTNAAVNNTGPGQHRLYDKISLIESEIGKLVEAQNDFTEKGWRNLPDDLGTALGLTETIRAIQRDDVSVGERLEAMQSMLEEHVARERQYNEYGPD